MSKIKLPPSDKVLREIVAKGIKRYKNLEIVEGILELEYLDAGFSDPKASILETGFHYRVEITYYDRYCAILALTSFLV